MYTVYASETNVHGCVIKPVFSGPPKPLMFSTTTQSKSVRSASELRAVVASIEGFGGHENA
jgi:hypothetical protein